MELLLKIESEAADWTVSRLYVRNRFECFVLEDEGRTLKVKGETRIPVGTFIVSLRTEGGFHQRYLKRFGPAFHHGMLWVKDVPGFEWILFHLGNTDEDTAGCLLVGQTWTGAGTISGSERAYRHFYPIAAAALLRGEEVRLTVQR